MRRLATLLLLAGLGAGAPPAPAQTHTAGTAQASAAACPAAAEVTRQHLLGLWRAQFEGRARDATLLLEPHPELGESLRGAINRDGERAALAGDVGDGEFSLEESANGVNISAVWLGDVVEGSCGLEIRGSWKAEGQPDSLPFVLRKLGAR